MQSYQSKGYENDVPRICQVTELLSYDTSTFPHHERLMRAYHSLISSGVEPLILDLGGNIGLSALWFAKQFPKARIFVLEPDAGNVKLLKQNLAGCDRVTVIPGAI